MKLAKLSLATMIAMSTSVFGADTLQDAFKNGKLDGEARTFIFSRDYDSTNTTKTDNTMVAVGVRLSYETAEFNGVKLGLGFQGQSTPWASAAAKADHMLPFEMGATGAILSEAYLAYSIAKTDIVVGRQFFEQPLMISDNSRLIKQAIEAVTVVSHDLPDTTLYAAYATRMHWMKDNAVNNDFANFNGFGILKPEADQGDYAWVAGVVNKSVKDLTLTLAYGEEDKSHSLLLAQADYTPMMGDVKLVTGIQYMKTDEDNSGYSIIWDDADLVGMKLGANYGPMGFYVAYSDIDVDGAGQGSWGVGMVDNKPQLYTQTIVDAGNYFDSEQYAIDAHYFVGAIGTVFGVRYVDTEMKQADDFNNIGAYVVKHFHGALEGFTCVAIMEQEDNDGITGKTTELRVRLSYEF